MISKHGEIFSIAFLPFTLLSLEMASWEKAGENSGHKGCGAKGSATDLRDGGGGGSEEGFK